MDKYTWDNYPASANLISILEKPENQRYSRTICKKLSAYLVRLSNLMSIQDVRTRQDCLKQAKNSFRDMMNQLDIPEIIKTHTVCVATSHYRVLNRVTDEVYITRSHIHKLAKTAVKTTQEEDIIRLSRKMYAQADEIDDLKIAIAKKDAVIARLKGN